MSLETIANEIAHVINGRVIKYSAARGSFPFVGLPEPYCAMGKYQDRAVCVDITPWGEHSIQYDCNIRDRFRIKKKGVTNLFTCFAGGVIKIGDKQLDKSLEIRCDNRRFMQKWLLSIKVRNLLIQIIPFTELVFNGSVLRYDIDQAADKIDTGYFINRIQTLREIIETLEKSVDQVNENS